MPRRGRDLERLVALIEGQLHGADGVAVQSPSFLPDVDTGKLREFDVLIEFTLEHHRLRLAVECKDHRAKVDSGTVGAFSEKCRSCGVHSGVIVSSSGFTGPASEKAEKKNIRLLTLVEAGQFDWCLCPHFTVLQPEILDGMVECLADEPIAQPYRIYCDDGSEFTGEHAGKIAAQELGKYIPEGTFGGPHDQCIQYGPQSGYIIDANGNRQTISGMKFWLTYKITERVLPLHFYRYHDGRSGEEIASATRAKFDVGNISALLTMLKQPGGDIRVILSHEPSAV